MPIGTDDNKFVIDDVEFYVVRPQEGSDAINSIYFNEFQSNTEGQNQVAKVTNNTFKLNGLVYVIDGNEISIPSVTQSTEGKGKYKEWKCDIVDDRFQFDGTWYVLVRDETTNNYVSVGYSDNKDNILRDILVTEDGYAEYKPWNIQFQFVTTGASAWKIVNVVKKHQSDVIDRLKSEWCEFDEAEIDLSDENKTYDWYVANEILRIQNVYATEGLKLSNLGNGLLFNGALILSTM